MTKAELRGLLEHFDGEARPVLMALLNDPMSDLKSAPDSEATSTSDLLLAYRIRADRVRGGATPALGFDESVERFAATSHSHLHISVATGPGGLPWAVAFLAPDKTKVIAAVAMLAQPTPS